MRSALKKHPAILLVGGFRYGLWVSFGRRSII